jgi:hypothetical protein
MGRSVHRDRDPRVGLCADCRHVERVTSSRGATFYLCRLSITDHRFPKYPALPVLNCQGYDPRPEQNEER